MASARSLSARVQAHRLSSVLALHEGVPRAMDHHSSGCLPAEKFPTCASDRQDRGATTLLGVDPTVVSPAAISITAAPAERSCQGRTDHTVHVLPYQRGQRG